MDDIVKQAMAKWPNVPYCYGWLALDARGNWRMRDERAQHLNRPGDKLTNAALVGFIARNYQHDERGCWYFQNGPQRVYLNLETTPFVARTDPAHGFVLHTGAPLEDVEAAFITEAGELILQAGDIVAQLDDRDAAQVLASLEAGGKPVADEALLAWIEGGAGTAPALPLAGRNIALQRIARDEVPARFGFVRAPVAP
ncbi:Protein of unknown function (DUF2946) [Pseudoduganella flava]|uniref:DUF2946 family protein n=1 Tax=Pseudoduganella flava TaxID=871742 RepID=A0A562PWG4_9BURK|nr:DUF2946 family protein [Pseudoduganella flava]QGZ39866.1 DUF2946 family protein [Pseudoduganella flava]TWI48792.1 Protein of unknown function (DUF2946) [Pseudoduganella flava]